jgi:proline racemase
MSVNLLLSPSRSEADAGFIVLQSDKAHAMSGSNSICVVTALLELGYLPMVDGHNPVVLDTAAGLVFADAQARDGVCESVSLNMPAAFVHTLDAIHDVPGLGRVRLDIAFGGVFYGLVDVEPLGLSIDKTQARELARYGNRILETLNARIDVRHPHEPSIHGIAYVMFRESVADDHVKTCTVLPPGRVDRSPCGTGSSAHMATLMARGRLTAGDRFVSESTIGGRFEMQCRDIGRERDLDVVWPRVTGRAWIYGFQQLGLDPDDPLGDGFTVSDTWGA